MKSQIFFAVWVFFGLLLVLSLCLDRFPARSTKWRRRNDASVCIAGRSLRRKPVTNGIIAIARQHRAGLPASVPARRNGSPNQRIRTITEAPKRLPGSKRGAPHIQITRSASRLKPAQTLGCKKRSLSIRHLLRHLVTPRRSRQSTGAKVINNRNRQSADQRIFFCSITSEILRGALSTESTSLRESMANEVRNPTDTSISSDSRSL